MDYGHSAFRSEPVLAVWLGVSFGSIADGIRVVYFDFLGWVYEFCILIGFMCVLVVWGLVCSETDTRRKCKYNYLGENRPEIKP